MCARHAAEQFRAAQGGSAAEPPDRRLGSLRGQLGALLPLAF